MAVYSQYNFLRLRRAGLRAFNVLFNYGKLRKRSFNRTCERPKGKNESGAGGLRNNKPRAFGIL